MMPVGRLQTPIRGQTAAPISGVVVLVGGLPAAPPVVIGAAAIATRSARVVGIGVRSSGGSTGRDHGIARRAGIIATAVAPRTGGVTAPVIGRGVAADPVGRGYIRIR